MSVRLRRGTVVVLEPRPRRAGGRLTAAGDSLDAVGVAIMVADADTAEAAQAGRSPCSPDVTGQPNDGQTSARTDAPIGFPACRAVEVTRRARFSAAGGLRRAKYTAGLAVAVPLLRRARRRRTWQADLAMAEDEVAWFAHSLVPDLRRAASLDQAAGGWAVGSSRVSALEDRLTALEATAPDDADRGRARTLRDAVRASRNRLGGLIAARDADALLRDLDAVAAELDTALASHA